MNEDKTKPLFWIAGLYVPFLTIMTALTGHLSHLGDPSLFFYPFGDGPGYKVLADYYSSFGNSQRPADILLEVRPFLFPVYLSLYKLIGVAGMQLLQVVFNVLSLWFVYLTVASVSGRSWIGGLSAALLAATPSFNFLAFHALTENLSGFLICVFMVFIVDYFQRDLQMSLYKATFIVTLLLCVRPIVMPFWLCLTMFTFAVWIKDHHRKVWQPVLILTPVFCQLIISFMMVGALVPASSGESAFAGWYFPVVYGQQEYGKFTHRKTPEGREALSRYPETNDKLVYVAEHYPTAIKSYLSLLVGESLLAGSNFVSAGISDHADRRAVHVLKWWSTKLNRFFAGVHVVMFGVMVCWLISRRALFSEKAALICYTFAVFLVLPSGLVYFQGDRYIVLAEALWLLAYGALTTRIINDWSARARMKRLPLSPLKT